MALPRPALPENSIQGITALLKKCFQPITSEELAPQDINGFIDIIHANSSQAIHALNQLDHTLAIRSFFHSISLNVEMVEFLMNSHVVIRSETGIYQYQHARGPRIRYEQKFSFLGLLFLSYYGVAFRIFQVSNPQSIQQVASMGQWHLVNAFNLDQCQIEFIPATHLYQPHKKSPQPLHFDKIYYLLSQLNQFAPHLSIHPWLSDLTPIQNQCIDLGKLNKKLSESFSQAIIKLNDQIKLMLQTEDKAAEIVEKEIFAEDVEMIASELVAEMKSEQQSPALSKVTNIINSLPPDLRPYFKEHNNHILFTLDAAPERSTYRLLIAIFNYMALTFLFVKAKVAQDKLSYRSQAQVYNPDKLPRQRQFNEYASTAFNAWFAGYVSSKVMELEADLSPQGFVEHAQKSFFEFGRDELHLKKFILGIANSSLKNNDIFNFLPTLIFSTEEFLNFFSNTMIYTLSQLISPDQTKAFNYMFREIEKLNHLPTKNLLQKLMSSSDPNVFCYIRKTNLDTSSLGKEYLQEMIISSLKKEFDGVDPLLKVRPATPLVKDMAVNTYPGAWQDLSGLFFLIDNEDAVKLAFKRPALSNLLMNKKYGAISFPHSAEKLRDQGGKFFYTGVEAARSIRIKTLRAASIMPDKSRKEFLYDLLQKKQLNLNFPIIKKNTPLKLSIEEQLYYTDGILPEDKSNDFKELIRLEKFIQTVLEDEFKDPRGAEIKDEHIDIINYYMSYFFKLVIDAYTNKMHLLNALINNKKISAEKRAQRFQVSQLNLFHADAARSGIQYSLLSQSRIQHSPEVLISGAYIKRKNSLPYHPSIWIDDISKAILAILFSRHGHLPAIYANCKLKSGAPNYKGIVHALIIHAYHEKNNSQSLPFAIYDEQGNTFFYSKEEFVKNFLEDITVNILQENNQDKIEIIDPSNKLKSFGLEEVRELLKFSAAAPNSVALNARTRCLATFMRNLHTQDVNAFEAFVKEYLNDPLKRNIFLHSNLNKLLIELDYKASASFIEICIQNITAENLHTLKDISGFSFFKACVQFSCFSHILHAVQNNHLALLKKYAKLHPLKINVNKTYDNKTLLMIATEKGYVEIVSYLLDQGATLTPHNLQTLCSFQNFTPDYFENILSLLLNNPNDILKKMTPELMIDIFIIPISANGKDYMLPFIIAKDKQYVGFACAYNTFILNAYLINQQQSAAAPLNDAMQASVKPIHMKIDFADRKKGQKRHSEQALLELEIKLSSNRTKKTMLQHTLFSRPNLSTYDFFMEVRRNHVDNLIQLAMFSNISDVVNEKDDLGETPLIIAAKNGYKHMINYLLANKADPACVDKKGFNALTHALMNQHFDVVHQLLILIPKLEQPFQFPNNFAIHYIQMSKTERDEIYNLPLLIPNPPFIGMNEQQVFALCQTYNKYIIHKINGLSVAITQWDNFKILTQVTPKNINRMGI